MFSISQFFLTSEYLCQIVLHFSNQIKWASNGAQSQPFKPPSIATYLNYFHIIDMFISIWSYILTQPSRSIYMSTQTIFFSPYHLKEPNWKVTRIVIFSLIPLFNLGSANEDIFPLILLFHLGNVNEDMVSITLENQ